VKCNFCEAEVLDLAPPLWREEPPQASSSLTITLNILHNRERCYMKLVVILGSQAVGKMTVGQELVKITKLKLFHNHVVFEFILKHFGEDFRGVSDRLKDVIYNEFSKSDNYGLVVTCCMNFDTQDGWGFLNHITRRFKEVNAEIYYAELTASQEIRLLRNNTENRLLHKASKRNIEKSNENLINIEEKYRFESNDGEIYFENYIKIDNSNISPDVVARMIKERFLL
jgi:hypothetical protein